MLRNVDLKEISDGRLYEPGDFVKIGSNGCAGCHSCCKNMGDTIVLDPFDMYNLCRATGLDFMGLNGKYIKLAAVDGVILPELDLSGEDNSCNFLDEAGRCTIHKYRPAICRMFPLGRIFENSGHKYFYQTGQCPNARDEVRIEDWLGFDNPVRYEKYTDDWHYFIKKVAGAVAGCQDDDKARNICMYILNTFYIRAYEEDDFYGQFYERYAYINNNMR